MKGARRCSACAISWPDRSAYYKCPVCRRATWDHDDIPLTEAEAGRAQFDAYYRESRGVNAAFEGDPELDPKREEIPVQPCTAQHEDGFICWYCDEIPRYDEHQFDTEEER